MKILLIILFVSIVGCSLDVAETNKQKPPTLPKYEIIKDTHMRHFKRSVDVRLTSKVSKEILGQIANNIRNADKAKYERTFIVYYLPKMILDADGWATTHFNPKLEVKILDLQPTIN